MLLIINSTQKLVATLISMLLLFSTPLSADHREPIYSFGVVPQFDSRRIVAIWRPILDELQNHTGLQFSLRGSRSIPDFEKEFTEGSFDFSYMNPYHILKANQQQGYLPLVRDIGRDLYGIIVVKKDSPIQKVEDLDGKLIAFPAPNALGASLMIRADFHNNYHIKIKPKYVNTHTSVYLNVALGETDAGGGVQKTLAGQRPEVLDELRVLYKTQKFPPHPISAHPRVPVDVQQQVKQALLAMGKTRTGKALLAKIPIQKIGATEIADYTAIDQLGLDDFYQE